MWKSKISKLYPNLETEEKIADIIDETNRFISNI